MWPAQDSIVLVVHSRAGTKNCSTTRPESRDAKASLLGLDGHSFNLRCLTESTDNFCLDCTLSGARQEDNGGTRPSAFVWLSAWPWTLPFSDLAVKVRKDTVIDIKVSTGNGP